MQESSNSEGLTNAQILMNAMASASTRLWNSLRKAMVGWLASSPAQATMLTFKVFGLKLFWRLSEHGLLCTFRGLSLTNR